MSPDKSGRWSSADAERGSASDEARVKTEGAGVLSHGIISMLAYGVNFGASFFAVIGIMRLMDKGSYGLFSLAITIVASTSMIADFGISPVIMRRLAINPGRSGSILLEATSLRFLLLLPTWIVTVAVGWWQEPTWDFMWLLNIMLLNAVVSSKVPVIRGTLEAFYRSQSRMGLPTLTMAIDSLVLLTSVLLFPLLFTAPYTAMLLYTASNLLGAVLLTVLSVRFARKLNTEPVRITRAGMRDLLVASAPLAVYLLLHAVHLGADAVLLKRFHGAVQVSDFTAAMRIMSPLAVFPTIIAISVAPYFARASVAEDEEQRQRMSRLFSLSVKTLLVGAVLLAGLGITNAGVIIDLLVKGKFADSIIPMSILFIAFVPMSLNMFLVEINNARGHLSLNTRFAGILAVFTVAAGLLLIGPYSATGAAVGRLIAIIAGMIYLLLRSRTGITVAMKPVIWKSALLGFVLVASNELLSSLHWVVANSLSVGIVAVLFIVLRVYSPAEIEQWRMQISSLLRRDA
ncbi:oligosaccharide flippase family protein [bacterium]|nr:oligosaccharide flippase family protein [bacterium]